MQWLWWTVSGWDNEPGCFNFLFRFSWPRTLQSRTSTAWRTSTWPSTARCWGSSPSRSTSSSSTLQGASCSPWLVSSHLPLSRVFPWPRLFVPAVFHTFAQCQQDPGEFLSSPVIEANRDEGFSSHYRKYLCHFCWGGSGRGLLSPPDQVCG